MAHFHDCPQWRPGTIVWAKYGKQPNWPSAVEYDRGGEAKVKFLGLHSSGDVPRESLVRFAEGFQRYSRRCKRADFVIGLKEAITRFHTGASGDFAEEELAKTVLSEENTNLFLACLDKDEAQELTPLNLHSMYRKLGRGTPEKALHLQAEAEANKELAGPFYRIPSKLMNGRPCYIHHSERYYMFTAQSLYIMCEVPEYQKYFHMHKEEAQLVMMKDNVDPGLLDLDDEALIEEWVISTELGIPNPDGSGVNENPNGTVVARALDSAKRPGQISAGWVVAREGDNGR